MRAADQRHASENDDKSEVCGFSDEALPCLMLGIARADVSERNLARPFAGAAVIQVESGGMIIGSGSRESNRGARATNFVRIAPVGFSFRQCRFHNFLCSVSFEMHFASSLDSKRFVAGECPIAMAMLSV